MFAYTIRRLILIPITLILITIIVFFMVRFVPGTVVDVVVAELSSVSAGQIDRAAIEHALGLDVSLPVQYGRWLWNIIGHGDFGVTLRSGKPVTEEIVARVPITFELGILALIIGWTVSIPIGVYSAIRQDTIGDYIGRTIAIICISVPSFWIGTMILIYPSLWWGWSPSMEVIPFFENPIGNLGMFLLPAFIMGMMMTGGMMRMTRTMMLEVLRQDYIRTAWSKGLTERAVILRHALKNALIPVVTIMGAQLPMLLGGSVIIEQIFCLPGMGRLMLTALGQREYPTVSGITVILSTAVLVCNLVVDLAYGWLDPRVKY